MIPGPPSTSQSSFPEVLDSYGYSLVTPTIPSNLESPTTHNRHSVHKSEKLGIWGEAQWKRVHPLFRVLLYGPSSTSPALLSALAVQGTLLEHALLWVYSRVNDNYYLACQNEGQCWRDLRAVLDQQSSLQDRTSQQPKRNFRDSMTKTIELLKISMDLLDKTLETATNQEAYQQLRRKVSVTLAYEEARLGQILLNIADEQNEVCMRLMVQQLKESRCAIDQAISVGRLTKLAFVSVPLATVCSAFSMNVRELDVRPSMWLCVVISLVCTVAAAVASSARVRRVCRALRR